MIIWGFGTSRLMRVLGKLGTIGASRPYQSAQPSLGRPIGNIGTLLWNLGPSKGFVGLYGVASKGLGSSLGPSSSLNRSEVRAWQEKGLSAHGFGPSAAVMTPPFPHGSAACQQPSESFTFRNNCYLLRPLIKIYYVYWFLMVILL